MIWFLRNIPNILTALRLACAPALALLLLWAHQSAALAVFVFAGLTDAADGWLAKRFHLATRFGRYLDPAADKLLMLFAFVALTAMGVTPLWLTVVVIARDAAIVGGIVVAKSLALPLRVVPLPIGKISTAVQVAYIALVLVVLAFDLDWPQISAFAAVVTGAFTIASWLAYGQVWLKAAARGRRAA
ncbi:MAG TPA: CDP-alcohol phosphatidyltransferase family protein [Rhizomicrobium sp.]|nr:CDP-alcohol phosphatidyltransferase family protein [Rhizomicrobium sp.]